MSQTNPYQSVPSLPNSGKSIAKQKPGGLTAIPVICLILGALGIITGLLGVVMTVFQGFANNLQQGMQMDPGMAEFQAKMQEVQQIQFVPNLIANGCNLIVGSLLVVGAIGVFGLKEWGRKLLRNALLFASVFVVLRGLFMIWVQYSTMGVMAEAMPIPGGASGPGAGPETFKMMMQAGVIVGIVIGLAWVGLLLGFYLWSRSYLNKESVVPFFVAAR